MADTILQFSPGAFLAPAVDWLNTNLHPLFAAIGYVVEAVLSALEATLLSVPPYALIVIVFIAAFFAVSIRAAILAGLCLGFCLLVGLWTASMQTVALVTVAVLISVTIAFPIGVLCSRHKTLEAIVRPVLDVMQAVPPRSGGSRRSGASASGAGRRSWRRLFTVARPGCG